MRMTGPASTPVKPESRAQDPLGPLAHYEQGIIDRITDFKDPRQEWRRMFSEVLGTFFLVLVAAGGGMMGQAFPGHDQPHRRCRRAGADGHGHHLVHGQDLRRAPQPRGQSIAFALRRDFPWRRVPGYIVAQLAGATLAALFLRAVINVSAKYGSNYPAHGYSNMAAFWMELILTMGLVSVILGTASGAQNVGIIGAFGVGGYIALAGLWGSPISGASMNPARTFGPDLVCHDLHRLLGLRRRTDRRRRAGGGHRLRPPRPRRRQVRLGRGPGRPLHRGREHRRAEGREMPVPPDPEAGSQPGRDHGALARAWPPRPAASMAACALAPSSEMRSSNAIRT